MACFIVMRYCSVNGCGSTARSDLTPSPIHRKLSCDTRTRLVATSLYDGLINLCVLRLRLREIEAQATA
jgi:hypothetical protein